LEIEFSDGRLGVIPGGGAARKSAGKSPRASVPKPSQGSLFDEE
jgi:hypothetical protein